MIPIKTVTRALVVLVVVNSLTLMYYQCTDLGYLFVADFHYPLSLIFARLLAVGIGVG